MKRSIIFHRSEIEPWAKAYCEAEPLPQLGYLSLIDVGKSCGAPLSVIHPIARAIGVPMPFFITAKGRQEYVKPADASLLRRALADHIAEQELTNPSADSTPNEDIPPSTTPVIQAEDKIPAKQRKESTLQQANKNNLMQLAASLRCSSHVIRFLVSVHPAFEGEEVRADTEGDSYVEEDTAEKIYDLITEATGPLPRGWVFAGAVVAKPDQYVRDLRKAHPEFKRHIQQVSLEIPGHGNLFLTHCSPQAFQAITATRRKDAQAARESEPTRSE